MKTITTFLMFALLAATMIVPAASAKADLDLDVEIASDCPQTTVERAVCIVMDIAGPAVDLVWDETWYHYGIVMGIVVKECNHLTSKCPLAPLVNLKDATAFQLLA